MEDDGLIYCYGDGGECLWKTKDCALDVDCRRYRDDSPRYTDNYTCAAALRGEPETLETKWWRADACGCRQPRSSRMNTDSQSTESRGDDGNAAVFDSSDINGNFSNSSDVNATNSSDVNATNSSDTNPNVPRTGGILNNIAGAVSRATGTLTNVLHTVSTTKPTHESTKKALEYTLVCEPCGCGGTAGVDFKTLGPVHSVKQCMAATSADPACLTKTFTFSSRNRQCWCRLHDRCPHPQQYPEHPDWVVYRAGILGICGFLDVHYTCHFCTSILVI